MRIIFIPGFAEDETIFRNITPLIEGEKIVLNSWTFVKNGDRAGFNVMVLAGDLVAKYQISPTDILIGHSMGGWIAYHIKQLVGCRIIHIASMTSTDRVIPPVMNNAFVYWLIKKRLVFNPLNSRIALFLGLCHHRYSRDIFRYFARLLEKGDPAVIIGQVRTILNPVNVPITVRPDLRIHSKNDNILRPPREPFYEVPGDHFTLYTHAEAVALPVNSFLQNL